VAKRTQNRTTIQCAMKISCRKSRNPVSLSVICCPTLEPPGLRDTCSVPAASRYKYKTKGEYNHFVLVGSWTPSATQFPLFGAVLGPRHEHVINEVRRLKCYIVPKMSATETTWTCERNMFAFFHGVTNLLHEFS
jgi:hypothetical protein